VWAYWSRWRRAWDSWGAVYAADLENSADHPLVGRYKGAEIAGLQPGFFYPSQLLRSQQLRQPGNIHSNTPRLIEDQSRKRNGTAKESPVGENYPTGLRIGRVWTLCA
jgi:hypothetical protein